MKSVVGFMIRLSLALCTTMLAWLPLAGLAQARPGHVLRATLERLDGLKLYRMVYASTGVHGEPIDVTGVIVVPDGPAPAGGREIVAWAHPTTGVAPACAPSLRSNVLSKIPGLPEMLAHGYIVAATDYPGLGTPQTHPYLVGVSEGRAVLDSVRAARDLLGAEAGRRFVVWGHSQGGHASLWTGQLASSYAPELKLEGVAAAAPASELAALFTADLSTIQGKVLTSLTLWSWSRVYHVPLAPVAAPAQIADIDEIASLCPDGPAPDIELFLTAKTLQSSFLKVKDLADIQPWRTLLARNTPTGVGFHAPVFIAQGTADTIVRPTVTGNFVQKLCRQGKAVAFDLQLGLTHTQISRAAAPAAVAWMADRFAHRPAPSNCGDR